MASQLVPSRGAILIAVTSPGQQNTFQKSRSVNRSWLATANSMFELTDYFEMVFLKILPSANMVGFPRASHIVLLKSFITTVQYWSVKMICTELNLYRIIKNLKF